MASWGHRLPVTSRRAGSVLYDVEVPDFAKEPMTISSLALTSAASGMTPTVRPKDPLAKLLPAPLTSYRDFLQSDELAVFAEVYESAPGPAHNKKGRPSVDVRPFECLSLTGRWC